MAAVTRAILGRRIRELRSDANLTQQQLGRKLRDSGLTSGTSTQHISQVERGETWPSLQLVKALDKVLQSHDELFCALREAKVPSFPDELSSRISVTAHLFYPLLVADLPPGSNRSAAVEGQLLTPVACFKQAKAGVCLYSFPFNVLVLHEQHVRVAKSLDELASWRDTQLSGRRCATADYLRRQGLQHLDQRLDHQPYGFSTFVFNVVPWEEPELRHRATQLLAMPRMLLGSSDPTHHTTQLMNSPSLVQDVVDYSLSGSHFGGASWAAVTLMHDGANRDLSQALVDFEVRLQAFWCYASNVESHGRFLCSDHDARFLKRTLARLGRPGPIESTAVRRLREAVVETSRIERLVHSALEAAAE